MGALYSTSWTTKTEKKTTIPINGYIRTLNCRPSGYSARTQFLKLDRINSSVQHDIDLTKSCKMFPVYDQGHLGSCTANGIMGCYKYDVLNSSKTDPDFDKTFDPSRLYFYYKEREKEGNTGTDAGANIADGIDVLQTSGVCSEAKWPYKIEKFADKPSAECDEEAKHHRSVTSRRVSQSFDDIIACLNAKFPVVFGFAVYESFEKIGGDGIVPIPKDSEKALGGHCVAIYGYDSKRGFKILNSWGESWGSSGFAFFPKEYILNDKLAFDFSVITSIVNENDELEKHINCATIDANSRAKAQTNAEARRTYKQMLLSKQHQS